MQKRQSPDTDVEPRSKRRKNVQTHEEASDSENDDQDFQDSENSVVESTLLEARLLSEQDAPMAGVIRRISMHNFMCHSKLDINFGTHVNFVVGRNGSGKSAVITALVVGLGGKAGITGRGRSIKNFVKSGKREAWVQISLNNKGRDSYKHYLYGDKIIVKRKFSVDGASSYSIHSESGQHISARRDELMHITNHFNIQVDNPVSILNQDTSRNFLNSKSSGDKFKFFMRATQLEQMSLDYEEVHRHKESAHQDIHSKSQVLPSMRKEVRVWETKFKNLSALSDLKNKVSRLKNEMAWAIVAEKERGAKPLEKNLRSEEATLPRFVEKVDEAKRNQESWAAQHKELEQKIIECGAAFRDLEPQLQARNRDVAEAKEYLAPMASQLNAINRQLHSARAECKQCEERIEELRQLASKDYDAERRQREEEITRLEASLTEVLNKQRVMEHEMAQYNINVTRCRTELQAIEAQVKARTNKHRETRMALQTLQAATSDRLQRFGNWMPSVIAQINSRKRQFHQVPKGPLGALFDLKDQKWALAVECCLKGLVRSFVCHDSHDEAILVDIFNRVCPRGRRPTVITCQFSLRVHDVSRHKVKSKEFPCILDVIKCADPVVVNTLIDQRSIENILLIEDSNTAREVMMRRPPENARECFTGAGDQAFCKPTFRYYSSDKSTVSFLMADVQEQITLLQREEEKLQAELNAVTKERTIKQTEIMTNGKREKGCQTQLNKLKQSTSRLQFEIRELQSVADPAPIDVSTLEEEVREYTAKIEELTRKKTQTEQEKRKRDDRLQQALAAQEIIKAEIREKSDAGIPLKEELAQAQAEIDTARNACKHYAAKLKEQERKIQESKKNLERYLSEVESDKAKALQICEPIRTQRSADDIEKEIRQTQQHIAVEEKEQGNEELITHTYRDKKENYLRTKGEINQLHNFLDKLDNVMEKRKVAYLKMRKIIANRTKYYFLMQMNNRNFKGTMNFDFNKEALDIMVNPGKDIPGFGTLKEKGKGSAGSKDSSQCGAATGSGGGDLRSLSGGERSFSTVCFILSLWEAMESPFRCLDEFDVFMDMVNRSISMDMMMQTANTHRNMQFVFLTPQDMSSVRKVNNCKIFQMPEPERDSSQSRLPFSQSQSQAAH